MYTSAAGRIVISTPVSEVLHVFIIQALFHMKLKHLGYGCWLLSTRSLCSSAYLVLYGIKKLKAVPSAELTSEQIHYCEK